MVYMRTPEGDFSVADLTARARIREAALRQFGEHGFKSTTIRSVAKEAGVSPALVQRHYGTKDGLREACDAHAIGTLLEQARRGMKDDASGPGFLAGMFAASRTSVSYLARALVEGSPGAQAWFDQGAELAEEFLGQNWPDRFTAGSAKSRDTAAVMAAMHGGTLVLHEHLSRRLGVDILRSDEFARVAAAIGEVYQAVGEYLGSGQGAQLHAAVAEHEQERTRSDD